MDLSKELEKNLQELQKENSKLKNSIDNLHKKCKDLELTVDSNNDLIGKLSVQNDDLKMQLDQKKKNIASLKDENLEKSREVELLNSEFNKASNSKQNTELEFNKIMKEKNEFKTENEIILRQLTEFKHKENEMRKQIRSIEEKCRSSETKKDDLEEDLVELRKEIGLKELKLQRTNNDIIIEKENLTNQIYQLEDYKKKNSVVLEQLVKFLEEDDDRIQILRACRNSTGKTFSILANELCISLPRIRVLVESLSKYDCVKVEHDRAIFKRFPWEFID